MNYIYICNADSGNSGRRSYHRVYSVNSSSTTNFAKQDNREAVQNEEDMDIGYEDTPPPLTFDGLERKFNDEIFRLVKEQSDLEDAEITRHKEVCIFFFHTFTTRQFLILLYRLTIIFKFICDYFIYFC